MFIGALFIIAKHCSFTYNSPKLQAIPKAVTRWADRLRTSVP